MHGQEGESKGRRARPSHSWKVCAAFHHLGIHFLDLHWHPCGSHLGYGSTKLVQLNLQLPSNLFLRRNLQIHFLRVFFPFFFSLLVCILLCYLYRKHSYCDISLPTKVGSMIHSISSRTNTLIATLKVAPSLRGDTRFHWSNSLVLSVTYLTGSQRILPLKRPSLIHFGYP